MLRVEFHCHTCYSKDSLVGLIDLREVAGKKGLDRVVITDHNNFQGAQEAHSLDPSFFIMGEEIMALEGELIGVFMHEFIPPGLPAFKTIQLLRQQGATIIVPHPFDSFRKGGWNQADLISITPHIDAIEIYNARCLSPLFNARAKDYARAHHLATTAGSDSHSLTEVGTSIVLLSNFIDSSSLKQALLVAELKTHLSPPWVHLYSRYAAWKKKRKRN
jgi:predicted metal-dependent phosphoesterase TrpH